MTNPCTLYRALVRALPLALLCAACSTVAVRVPVMKPAEINMSSYSSVAIGEMHGNYDRPMSNAIEEALVASQHFTVVDRQHMDRLMHELQISASDLADPKSAAKLGKVVAAGALIFGDVSRDYREVPSETHSKDKEGTTHTLYALKGDMTVRATFKIVDVSTGRLIIAKTYEEKRDDTNRGLDKRPDPIDRQSLERQARSAVVERFMKAIVPHQEYMVASFQKDGDIPQLEGGIGWAERGDWKQAQAAFNTAAQDAEKNLKLKPAQIAKAYWNLGLSYEYAGDYAKAVDMINKAYNLSTDRDMLSELDNVKRMQEDARKLAEQTGGAEAAGAK
jgi:hypothetical protein